MSDYDFPWSQELARRVVRRALVPSAESYQCTEHAGTLSSSWLTRACPNREDARSWCVAIGAFDGVHRGHQKLVGSCVSDAARRNTRSVAVLFDPDPSELFSTALHTRLLNISERMALLLEQGLDAVCALRFDGAVAAMTPSAFVEALSATLGGEGIVSVHVGSNFRFGARAVGDAQTLLDLADGYGFDVCLQELVELEAHPVSSTRVRAELSAGHVALAARLLGRAYCVRGSVRHGRGEGTSFGFPTANVVVDEHACLPSDGVYACYVSDGRQAWPAAANVGAPPTFSAPTESFLEANLIGFTGDLYGQEVTVIFVAWLRASRKFASLEELEETVLGNIAWVRDNLGDNALEIAP